MNLLALVAAFLIAPSAPPDDYPKTWADVSKAIEGRFYARKSRADEMKRLFAKYEPSAKEAPSRASFSKTVNDMIDEFKDSHFDFFTPSDQGYYLMDGLIGGKSEMPQIGAWFKPAGDGYTVQMVLDGGPAAKAGLLKGDVVLRVDGAPFSPIDSLADKVGKTARVELRRGRATVLSNVEVKKTTGAAMFLDATRDSVKIIEHGGKKIGYIHLWTMASQEQRDLLHSTVYGRFRETDAVILDIRDGFGGRPEGYGDPFFRPESNLEWKFGEGGVVNKQLFGYQRPLVVLINGGSRSAKEVFSHIIKKARRATLIGSNTAGHVLGTSPARLNDWAILEIPMVEVIADGVRLEGIGVAPHIKLGREHDEKGNDLYLAEALGFLTKK